MKKREIVYKNEKLNLIPIMDAVFIFIFFLLFSIQLIKLYEIEMDAPIVNEVPQVSQTDEDPLSLRVKIKKGLYVVTKGIDETEIKRFDSFEDKALDELNLFIWEVKKKYPNEKDVIVSPNPMIAYDAIVKVIDAVKIRPAGEVDQEVNFKGKEIFLGKKMFNNIALEPLN